MAHKPHAPEPLIKTEDDPALEHALRATLLVEGYMRVLHFRKGTPDYVRAEILAQYGYLELIGETKVTNEWTRKKPIVLKKYRVTEKADAWRTMNSI